MTHESNEKRRRNEKKTAETNERNKSKREDE